ncbi:MAG: hypothetical protein ABIO71_03790 [Caldimonas sp.]
MSDADPAFPAGSPAAPLLRALAEQVRDLVAVTDLIGTISWSNARFAAATGFVPGTLARSLLAFSAAGPAGTRTRLALAALLAAPEGEAGDLALQSLDGSTLWVDVRVGAIDGQLLWTLSDVSATHRLTEQAKRQGELLETAQQFGRLRIWERAIPAADGRWDDPLFGFWGWTRATARRVPSRRSPASTPTTGLA